MDIKIVNKALAKMNGGGIQLSNDEFLAFLFVLKQPLNLSYICNHYLKPSKTR